MIFSDAASFEIAKPEVTQEKVLHSRKLTWIIKKHGFEREFPFNYDFLLVSMLAFSGEYLPGN